MLETFNSHGFSRRAFLTFLVFVVGIACATTMRALYPDSRFMNGAAAASYVKSGPPTHLGQPPRGLVPAQMRATVYIYVGPESPDDHRYDYHWQVLREALDRTVPKYGPYLMAPASYMSEERQAFELQYNTGRLTVLLRGDTLEYEKMFEAVWIPVDKGLLGYRVFLIRREDQPHLTPSTTLDDLRSYAIGQGSGWKDIDILRANGLKVMAGGDYAGLFAMLANKRFDLFSRGVEEVVDEYASHKATYPNITIENNLLLYYPIARYFWAISALRYQILDVVVG